MEKIEQVLLDFNPELLKKLVKSDLDETKINDLFREKVGLYLPKDIVDLYQIFNGTLLNYENESGLYLRVDPNCFFFSNGYLLDLETAISVFEKNRKKFKKKGEIHFPIFGTGFEIYYTVILNKEHDALNDSKGMYQFIIGKNPSQVYDTFSLFLKTTIQAYETGVYYINPNGIFISKTYEEYQLKERLNPSSNPWV